MQLLRAHVTNYRPTEDSGEFEIDPQVTCLVGKNESGKTSILQAIYRTNPITPADFDEVLDFPSKLTRQLKRKPDSRITAIKATFSLTDEEIAEIEDDLGPGALTGRILTVNYGYRYRARTYGFSSDEAAIVKHLRGQLDISLPVYPKVTRAATLADFLAAMEEIEGPSGAIQKMISRIRSWRKQDVDCYLIDEHFKRLLPKFVYFGDYDIMPGKVSVPDLIERRATGALEIGEQALLSLLNQAGANLEEFGQTDNHERLIREAENASNAITDEVFDFWSQNKELEVELRILEPEPNAQPPLHRGPILQVRVRNSRHRVTVPFDERSRGFVWFFSFLAYFTDLEDTNDGNLILLLDEPGLSLHGRAQEDLLRLIDERLAPEHQVIFTTHSPFMVDPAHLDRVRTVMDHDGHGTKVSAEIFKADDDTVFPLLAAMGIELTQTLFIGEHNLLLEGPSDLIYLDILTDAIEAQGKLGLDPAWIKIPIGGAGKLSTFATLLGANKLDVAVMVDSSTTGVGAIKRLRDNGQLRDKALIEISEFTSANDADIEDLFEPDFYLDLVNRAYSKDLPTPITIVDLNPNDPRIVRQIETYFRANGIAGGKFSHYKPAAVLMREQNTLVPNISATTLARAEQLFRRINDLLP
ncbi:AAA family ATPase [Streptosporangium sp. NPDC006013]|uniref:AAA family ATPase n=1 Tax=Streptosporangium sp. NPDC006013 TaxID=3155596 RepID=UPI0033ACE2BD